MSDTTAETFTTDNFIPDNFTTEGFITANYTTDDPYDWWFNSTYPNPNPIYPSYPDSTTDYYYYSDGGTTAPNLRPIFSLISLLFFSMFCLFALHKSCNKKERKSPVNHSTLCQDCRAPIVVTSASHQLPGSFPQHTTTVTTGYPVPQPGYPPAGQPYPAGYPHPQQGPPYPMGAPHQVPIATVEANPPSYDQVVRGGGEVYQKQAPYNPTFSGQ